MALQKRTPDRLAESGEQELAPGGGLSHEPDPRLTHPPRFYCCTLPPMHRPGKWKHCTRDREACSDAKNSTHNIKVVDSEDLLQCTFTI